MARSAITEARQGCREALLIDTNYGRAAKPCPGIQGHSAAPRTHSSAQPLLVRQPKARRAGASGSAFVEEAPQQLRRPAFADAAVNFRPMVARRAREDARAMLHPAALRVRGAVVETSDAREADRLGAHRARLEG